MTDRELMQQWLDAIAAIPEDVEGYLPDALTDVLIATRERLAQPTSNVKQVIELYDRPEQEPGAVYGVGIEVGEFIPPRRQWVGLTRAERFEIEKAMSQYYDYRHECKTVCLPEFAAAIEAKLREKNT